MAQAGSNDAKMGFESLVGLSLLKNSNLELFVECPVVTLYCTYGDALTQTFNFFFIY